MRKYVVVRALSLSLSYIGGYCSAREEFNQLRGGVRVDLFMGAQVDVSDNYTSVERPPHERCRFPPQYIAARTVTPSGPMCSVPFLTISSSSLLPKCSPSTSRLLSVLLTPHTIQSRRWHQRAVEANTVSEVTLRPAS